MFPQGQEPAPIRRLSGGLMRQQPEPSPIAGMVLPLSERLFADDADVILDHPSSRSVHYVGRAVGRHSRSPGTAFANSASGRSPSGAPFLCIEPWRGYASPADFDGEFADKPGLMQIAPQATEILKYRIAIC